MLNNNRVILSQGASPTLTDISRICSDVFNGAQAITIDHTLDHIYIGSDLPFTNRALLFKAKNTIAGTVSVDIWDGTQFNAAVDVQDFTSEAGVPFAKSGVLSFQLSKNNSWGWEFTTEDIAELSTLKIYRNYWARLRFSANFVFELEYVGFKFSKDSDLRGYYSDLDRDSVRKALNNGLPMNNFDRQHVLAAEQLIKDLRKRQTVYSANQLAEWEQFTDACTHKCAEIIYSGLAQKDSGRLEYARENYDAAIGSLEFGIDLNGDGVVEVEEKPYCPRLRRV